MIQQVHAALQILRWAFRDVWKEMWTILIVHLIFLFGNILIVAGPPVTVALFFFGNRVAHGEMTDEREFIQAVRSYWKPAWRWGCLNLLVLAVLAGDYFLTSRFIQRAGTAQFLQGLYLALISLWLLVQIFALPFLFEQEQPLVSQALRNSVVFIRDHLVFVVVLALLLLLSLALGTLAFMLTFAFGGALVAFAANHAVVDELTNQKIARLE